MERVRGFLSSLLRSTARRFEGWSAEADVRFCPPEYCFGLLEGLVVLGRDGVTMPPLLPLTLDGADDIVAGHADVLTVDERCVALVEDRHVSDRLERPAAANVEIVGRRANLDETQLGEPVPGARPVAVAGDLLAPVGLVEDQAAAGGVRHHLTADAVEAGIADQLALITFQYVDAPADRSLVTPHLLEPLVLVFEHGSEGTAEVLGDLEVLHATTLDESRHLLALDRRHLDDEITNRKAHDRSESH